jgi:hypothetical protein
MASRAVRTCWKIALAAVPLLLSPCALPGATSQGAQHGFLVLRNLDGAILASGDYMQIPMASRVKLRLVFHFRDGSLDDDTTLYSQPGMRLISERHIQSGRSFPNPIDFSIDVPSQQVRLRAWSNGKLVVSTQSMDLPPNLANGIIFGLIQSLPPNSPKVEVPFLAEGAKPRMVTLAITPETEETFKVGGRSYKAMKYAVKVNLGGLAGVVAPMIGKQPPDTHVWVLESNVPAILRVDGSLFQEGPIWSIRLASPEW